MVKAQATERIRIPEQLDGPWDHALIVTFNADLAFYERALARKLGHVRHKVILADHTMLAETFAAAAHAHELRQVNGGYLAAPVRSPGSAHAKLILLTARQHGRLLVGSGNLSQSGYASQGEMFCRYTHSPDSDGDYVAFQAARDLIQGVIARRWVDDVVAEHVNAIWTTTPWLYAKAATASSPVRHNLDTPLLTQLADSIDGRGVKNLTVHAPFWDAGTAALRQLVERIQPRALTILVQDRQTKASTTKLEEVLAATKVPHEIRLADTQEHSYLHAKFILADLGETTVCMQGSANLSRAALTLTADTGNIEIVNLLTRPTHQLAHLLGNLRISRPTPLAKLDLPEPDPVTQGEDTVRRITRADWDGQRLTLCLSAATPPEAQIQLVLAGEAVSVPLDTDGGEVSCLLPEGLVGWLDRAIPVALRVSTKTETSDTPAVYPYRHNALRSTLSHRTSPARLRRTVTLEFDIDDNVERLLRELEEVLVIDRTSVWRLAGREPPEPETDGEETTLRLGDLDWDQIRSHPRLAQYRKSDEPSADASDLQILLGTIAARFGDLGDLAHLPPGPPGPVGGEELLQEPGPQEAAELDEDLAEEDIAAKQAEEEKAAEKLRQQARNAFGRFAKRFARGLTDPEFADLVGPATVVLNFILFNDLLSRLVALGMIKEESGVELQIRIWQHMFSSGDNDGYLTTLTGADAQLATKALQAHHAPASLLMAVRVACDAVWDFGTEEQLLELRDTWRKMLSSAAANFGANALLEAEAVTASSAADAAGPRLIDDLAWLATYVTEREILTAVAQALGVDPQKVRLDTAKVMRHRTQSKESVLEIEAPETPLEDEATAALALATWQHLDPERTYFRINHEHSKSVAVLDVTYAEKWYFDLVKEDIEPIRRLPRLKEPWEAALQRLYAAQPTERSA